MKTPTKENYVDRYIPVCTNARWKSSSFKPGISHTRRLFQPNPGTQPDGLFNDLDPNTQPGQQNTSGGFDRNWSRITTAFVGSSSARISREMPANEPQSIHLLSALVADELAESSSSSAFGANKPNGSNGVLSPGENSNFFSFKMRKDSPCKPKTSPYSMSPVSEKSQRLLKFPQKQTRRISRVPYEALDAPELQDDFYLNLVDWSPQNVLAVRLGTCVYLWNAFTSQVTRLCDVSGKSDVISSVAWSKKGSHLAISSYRGHVQIWDVTKSSCISSFTGHLARVGALAWNADFWLLAAVIATFFFEIHVPRPQQLSSTVPTATTGANQGTTNPDGMDDRAEMDDGELPVGDQRGTELMDTSSDDLLSSAQEHSSTLADTARPSPVESHTPHRAESGLPGGGDLDSVLPWSLPSCLMRASSVITSTALTQVNETVSDRNVRGAVRVLKDHRQEVCGLKWSPDSQYLDFWW
ncbi:Fizzy protein [Fasciola gigantica]|uniref:Fizzy protein n=1 Tax=Fasciola gigantica TaxID=46835 RepID=A0A504Y7P7_FASGI|nr:Fizzy protein [Fasciola gigantica]